MAPFTYNFEIGVIEGEGGGGCSITKSVHWSDRISERVIPL